jgi:bla regulator protein blaR1
MSPAELAAHPLSQAATLALLHFLWQGLVIAIGLVAVVELIGLRRPQTRYLCSLAALLLMTACPLVTVLWIGVAEGIGNRGQATGDWEHGAVAGVAPALTDVEAALPGAWQAAELVAAAQPYLLAAWLAGVAFFACRLLMGLVGVRQLRRYRLPLTRELSERVEQLGRRLGMRARLMVFLSQRVGEAMAVGLVKPIILIPAAWATEMPLAMLEAVIAHELAHLQRCDLWVVMLQRVVETLLFYHPAVWWLSRRLRAERELCCDELAVAVTGRRLEYVQALESVARLGTRVEPLFAAGIRGERNMQLLQRVRNVLGLSAAGERSRFWPAGLLALLLPLAAWAWTAGLVAPQTTVAVADDDRDDADDRDDDGDDDDDADERQGKRVSREDDDEDEGDDDDDDDGDDDDEEKEARAKGKRDADEKELRVKRERDEDDADEKEVRVKGKRDEDDADEKEAGEKKAVRNVGERKEIRKDGDDSEAARVKRERIEQLKFLGKDGEAKRDGVKKEGPKDGEKPAKIGLKDGEKPVKIGPKEGEKTAKEGEGRVAELMTAVKKLMAENERLRAELAEVRGSKREYSVKEKEGAIREKEAIAEKEAYKRAFSEKEAIAEKEAYKRAIGEKEAIAEKGAHKRAISEKEAIAEKQAYKRAIAEKEEAVARERKIKEASRKEGEEKKQAEAAEREKKEGEKQ